MATASQKEIARILGISQNSVSKALRGHPEVSDSLRQQVLDLARKLGYTPNLFARSLVDGHSRMIGCFMPGFRGKYYSTLTGELEQRIRQRGYIPVMIHEHDEEEDIRSLELLKQYRVAGLIVCPQHQISLKQHLHKEILSLRKLHMPLVLLGGIPLDNIDFVSSNDHDGISLGVHYLVEQGHRNITLLSLISNHGDYCIQQKELGFVSAMEELGLNDRADRYILKTIPEKSTEQVRDYLKNYPETTAFVCLDDSLAFSALDAVDALGIQIPRDLSVIGHGDDIEHQEYMRVPMTVIAHNCAKLAEQAVSMVFSQIAGKQEVIHELLDNYIISRKSVAPPRLS